MIQPQPLQKPSGFLPLGVPEPIHPGVWRWRCGSPEAISPVALREDGPATAALATLGDQPFPASLLNAMGRPSPRGYELELPLGADEEIAGFGLQLKSVRHRGRKRTLRVNADPLADSGDSHAPVPFYVSSAGYAVLVDSARASVFHCGSSARLDRHAGGPAPAAIADNVTDLYAGRRQAAPMLVEVPHAGGVDVYVFAGPTPLAAVQRYNLFSGGGCLPPLWGLGCWYRAWAGADAQAIATLAQELRSDAIPCDVFGLEPGWQSRAYPCSFVWDRKRFGDGAATLEQLGGLGYRVNLWEHCFTHPESPLFAELAARSGDRAVWGGAVPDLLMPAARKSFSDWHREQLIEKGVAGFKLDECDGSDFTGGWSFPDCARFPSGADGEQMHGLLGVLYQRAIGEAFRAAGRRTLSQTRSSGALAAPLPFVLYSDLYEHRDFLRGVVSAPWSGLLWAPEVRQCASIEDLVRRVQSAALSAMCLVNAWMIPHPPWFQVEEAANKLHQAMAGRAEATELVRAAFRLRMRLLPYLHSAFARYRLDGTPPLRALALDVPGHPAAWAVDDQWMFGEALLVAPLIAGQASRPVQLPPGDWYDFWSGERHAGGGAITVAAALEHIPLFVRSGHLLPLADPVEHIGKETTFRLTVRVYGAQPGSFRLWEESNDDGAPTPAGWRTLSWNPATGGDAGEAQVPGLHQITGWEIVA